MINFGEIVGWAAGKVDLPAAQKTIGKQRPSGGGSASHVVIQLQSATPRGGSPGGLAGVGQSEYMWDVAVSLSCYVAVEQSVVNPYGELTELVESAIKDMRRLVAGGDAPAGIQALYMGEIAPPQVGDNDESANIMQLDATIIFEVRDAPRFGDWGWTVANLDGVGDITAEIGMHSGTGQLTGNSPLGLRSDFGLTSYRGALAQVDPDGVGGNNEETYSLLADTKGTQGAGRLIYLLAEMQQGGSVVRHGHGGITPLGNFTGFGGSNMPIPDENWAAFMATDPAALPADQWRLLYYPAVRNWHGLTPRSWFAKRTGDDVVCYAPDLYPDGQYLTPRLVKATATIPE